MENNQYMSVTQVAKLLEVSTQYVYKKLKRLQEVDKQLYNQVATVTNDKKRVNVKLFADYIGKELPTDYQPGCKQSATKVQPNHDKETSINNDLVQAYKEQVELLKAEVENLRQQNNDLIRLLDQEQQLKLASDMKLLEEKIDPLDIEKKENGDIGDIGVSKKKKRGFFNLFK